MGGPSKPVSVDLGGPVFADGPAAYAVLAALPLAEGYATTYRNFDVQKQRVSLKHMRIAATLPQMCGAKLTSELQ